MHVTTNRGPAENDAKDNRVELASRPIPIMMLSTSKNPLTTPLPKVTTSTPAQMASARFAVAGNAIITGGAGVLALCAARALLEHGLSSLCLCDLASTLASSQAALSELRNDFPQTKIHEIVLDVTSSATVDKAFQLAASIMKEINILCCFAGIVGCVPSISVTPDLWRKVIDVNLTGSFLCAQAAARYMTMSGKGGNILFTSSISAHHVNYPQPQAAYNISKSGVSHLTRNLA